jgi:hypothetical protein
MAGAARAGLTQAASDTRVIQGRRGFDPATPLEALPVDAEGRVVLHGEELDRFELHLPPGGWAGGVRSGDTLAPLPIGSRLDGATGVFTWHPSVGFAGTYDLVFVRGSAAAPIRQEVRLVLHPRGSNRGGPQGAIDSPVPGTVLEAYAPFFLGGWAIDLAAVAGRGVNTVHVWAYPATDEAPRFLGAAEYGGTRPDVAALFGTRFTASGYGLVADGLPPGEYRLAVFAWSTARNGFVPARVVSVTVR